MKRKMEDIIDTYGDLLYRTSLMMLGEPQDAQDIVQEVMLKYLQKAPVFSDSEHEKAWLLRVTINLCKDMLRFRGRHRHLSLEALAEEGICIGKADAADMESRALFAEIGALPPGWKIVVLLHYVDGYSLKEIADILAISENAVKKRMQRAKAALKKRLKE